MLDGGYSFADAGRSLDVGASALRRWVEQLITERGGITPTSKAITSEQKNHELEARIKQLEDEKRLLIKATILLMSDELKPIR